MKSKNEIYDTVLRQIKKICAELFSIPVDKIDDNVDFDEYGLDSIMVNEFNDALAALVPDLPKTLLYEYKNIRELASLLSSKYEEPLKNSLHISQREEKKEPAPGGSWRKLKPIENTSSMEYRGFCNEEDMAIIGVSGKYPEASGLEEFWSNLKGKKDCIKEIPRERWDYRPYYDPDYENVKDGKMYAVWAGFLDNVDKFDPLFFNISPSDAEMIDPQERLFLEVAWETMEDAGYTRKRLRKYLNKEDSADVGVFVGTTTQTYQLWGAEEMRKGNPVLPNATPWSVANRVSYCFNFTGPSMPVDTSCSSGLTAVHLACESIKRGECSAAIAGGVNIFLHPLKFLAMSHMKMVSPTGRCSAFGNDANGFVPGEGVGAVLIKPLSKAAADHDHIYGIIKATGINHDGKTNGFTVPNLNAQARIISDVIHKSGLNPRTISYLEAHGTGTKLGDPIEVAAASKAFEENTMDKQFCAIGSLKANIGHLEGMAGIAGLTKVLLMMKHKQILPSIHSEVPNSNISFGATPFYVPQDLKEWEQPVVDNMAVPRRAGVSAFGAGGTNAHIILEEYEEQHSVEKEQNAPRLILLSAKNKGRIAKYVDKLISFVNTKEFSLRDFAFTLQAGREAMEERRAFIVHSKKELLDKLYSCREESLDEDNIQSGFVRKVQAVTSSDAEEMILDGTRETEETYLNQIATLWINGKDINWYTLYEALPYRISLPTYAFKMDSYYVSLTPEPAGNEQELNQAEKMVLKRHYGDSGKGDLTVSDITDITYIAQWKNIERLSLSHGKSEQHILLIAAPEGRWLAEKIEEMLPESEAVYLLLGRSNKRESFSVFEANIDQIVFHSEFVEKLRDIDSIYFLGGMEDSRYSLYDEKKLDEIQNRTTIALFRIVKNMEAENLLNHPLSLKIITNDVMSIHGDTERKPFSAGMSGFARGLVKEYPMVTAACMDVTAEDLANHIEETVQFMIQEETSGMPDDIAYRNGKRYVKKLVLNHQFTDAWNQPLKPEGVYFIIGGLGSIGFEFARYAIETSNAKIALAGRSRLTDEAISRMRSIGNYGEQIMYVQADCTDASALKKAMAEVKEKWGKITGVIHSAMVFSIALLRQLEEKDYIETLSSKVKGIVTLADVLRDENIDFMLYFSSAQAFMGNKQRVHYSTACSFVDAYADSLKQEADYKVKIVNWGFWGTDKGEKISSEYESFLAKRGIKPIPAEVGMEIVNRLLSGKFDQAVILTVNEKILEMLHVIRDSQADIIEESLPVTVTEPEQIMTEKHGQVTKEDFVRNKIIEGVIKILKIDKEDIDMETPFMELGVDSILGFKLVSEINDTLQVDIKETTLFDYPNIKALAEYVEPLIKDMKIQTQDEDANAIESATDQKDSDKDAVLDMFKKLANQQISADNASQFLEV